VPEKARERLRFVWLERVDDAIEAALNPPATQEPGGRHAFDPRN
jgi:ATP-dependent Lon protease